MKVVQIKSQFLDSNTFVVENDNEVLIVDCGVDVEKIKNEVGEKQVAGILLTHGHYDHSIFCKEYAKTFNTKIYAQKNVVKTLANGRANYSEGQFELSDFSNFCFLDDDCSINLGSFEIQCLIAKGHSICSMCYKIGDLLFAGDVLFENGIGRTDLIGSNKEQMIESLTKLDQIEFADCFSGHGNTSDYKTQQKNIKVFKRFLSR